MTAGLADNNLRRSQSAATTLKILAPPSTPAKPTIRSTALTIFVRLEKIAQLGAQGGRLSGWLSVAFGVFNLVQNFRH